MEKSRPHAHAVATAALILMAAVCLMGIPAMACPADGRVCGDCIRDRLELDCPGCAPPLRCMAQCLWWGGATRSKCVKRCDNGGSGPRLAECRRCMARCKCSCPTSST